MRCLSVVTLFPDLFTSYFSFITSFFIACSMQEQGIAWSHEVDVMWTLKGVVSSCLFLLPLRGLPQWWLTGAWRRQEPIYTRSPWADGLMSPLKDVKVTLLLNFWVRAECTMKRKKKFLLPVGLEPGTSGSAVQHFNHLTHQATHVVSRHYAQNKILSGALPCVCDRSGRESLAG